MSIKDVLKQPIITEKSMTQTSLNRYTFKVARNATKGQIKQAIKKAFKVDVIDIKTTKIAGKKRRVGRSRRQITKPEAKKAIVQLKEGQKIDIFETQT